MNEVAVLGYPDVDELDIVGVLSPLRKASAAHPAALSALLVGASNEVISSGGLRLSVDSRPEGHDWAALVLPGGKGATSGEIDVWRPLVTWATRTGVSVYAVCTAGVALARWGLLGDHSRVASHADKKALLRGAGYRGEIVAGVTCQGGITLVAGPGLPAIRPVLVGLYVIEDLVGAEAASAVARSLEVDWPAISTVRERTDQGA